MTRLNRFCSVLLVSCGWAGPSAQAQSLVPQHVREDPVTKVVRATLQNFGSRKAVAFLVATPSGGTIFQEFAPRDDAGIPPGGTYDLPIRANLDEARKSRFLDFSGYFVRAVLYEDGSAEGDQRYVDELFTNRSGYAERLHVN